VEKKAKRSYFKDEEALLRIGQKIRKMRISNGMSQESLSFECELDYSQINRMELGKVNFTISNLYRIAKVLNVHPKDFLD